jgi:hypothetical protein
MIWSCVCRIIGRLNLLTVAPVPTGGSSTHKVRGNGELPMSMGSVMFSLISLARPDTLHTSPDTNQNPTPYTSPYFLNSSHLGSSKSCCCRKTRARNKCTDMEPLKHRLLLGGIKSYVFKSDSAFTGQGWLRNPWLINLRITRVAGQFIW